MSTLVFGHKSPDTDSTGSPIIWAWYLTNLRGGDAKAVLLGEPNTEAAFMLKHWGLEKPEIIADVAAGQNVVIVDTNNPAELPTSINDANIMAIIDHHMLVGGLKTKTPINVVIRPLACTATVMHDIMGEDVAKLPREIKGAMLSCILSDTLEFRSPTTTPHDRAVAEKLDIPVCHHLLQVPRHADFDVFDADRAAGHIVQHGCRFLGEHGASLTDAAAQRNPSRNKCSPAERVLNEYYRSRPMAKLAES